MALELLLAGAGPTAAFDVEAATRAYLELVQGEARERSDAYFEGGYWLLLWGALLGAGVNLALLHFGWSARWSRWASGIARRPFLRTMLYAVPYILATTILLSPWAYYTGFVREHQYGMSNQSFGAWASEEGIALGLTLVFGAPVIAIVYTVIRRAPRSWCLWGTGVAGALLAFGMLVSPLFIAPFFNSFTPMAEGPLKQQILAMAAQHDVPASDVFVADESLQTDRISAFVSGLGPTIRISLNDNLLNRTAPEEVKAVMGHELGHYVLNHVVELIVSVTAVLLAIALLLWWAAPRLLARHRRRWGVRDVADPASLPLLAALGGLTLFLATPLTNSLIRWNEIEADRFGLDTAREPDGFAKIAMRLSEYRKLEPSALEEAIFFTHPSGRNRVRMAMEWKARNLATLPPGRRTIVRPEPLRPPAP